MQRRILIGCGAAFLVALMLVCTFSAGIVLGERGVMRVLATQAARGTPASFQVPVIGTPNVIGTVQRYGDNSITLRTAEGLRTITVNAQTFVRHQDIRPAQVDDLKLDVPIAVWGENSENGRVLLARTIVILIAKP